MPVTVCPNGKLENWLSLHTAVVYSNLSFEGCLRSGPMHIYQVVLQSKLYCRVFWYNFTKWDLEFSWKFTCKSKKSCYKLSAKDWNDFSWKRMTLNSFTGNWPYQLKFRALYYPLPHLILLQTRQIWSKPAVELFLHLLSFVLNQVFPKSDGGQIY